MAELMNEKEINANMANKLACAQCKVKYKSIT